MYIPIGKNLRKLFCGQSIITDDAIIITASLIVCLSALGTILEASIITSILFAISLVGVVWTFIMFCCRIGSKRLLIVCLLLFLMLIATIARFDELGLDFNKYKRLIMNAALLLCFALVAQIRVSDKAKRIVVFLFACLAVFIAYLYYFGSLKYSYYSMTSNLITLNFGNPNETGLWLVCIIIVLSTTQKLRFSRTIKFVFICVITSILPILFATGSRNSMFALLLYAFGYFIVGLLKLRKLPRFFLWGIVVSPLLIFLVYMFIIMPLQDKLGSLPILSMGEAKGVGNRFEVWSLVLDNFASCLLIGDYAAFFNQQMHNSTATMFCTYGLPFVVMFSFFIYNVISHFNNENGIFALVGFAGILFTGLFESSIFFGGASLFLVVLIIPAIALNGDIFTASTIGESI